MNLIAVVINNFELLIQGKDPLPFEFQDNGEMISLGIGEASISGLGVTSVSYTHLTLPTSPKV